MGIISVVLRLAYIQLNGSHVSIKIIKHYTNHQDFLFSIGFKGKCISYDIFDFGMGKFFLQKSYRVLVNHIYFFNQFHLNFIE